jgi:hypothetical protein
VVSLAGLCHEAARRFGYPPSPCLTQAAGEPAADKQLNSTGARTAVVRVPYRI